ncbi:hypothetical protein O181_036490 [Austropuccinia psidii MF-1]|uniref:Uncharacterized protein n=1 Tax=Austropuccinia psidii MF-1 TaxID=1389203 RepID=A0A9Q3D924_9BASI|nr:hypothetical protein [Austropuccinia psidii MF-1]
MYDAPQLSSCDLNTAHQPQQKSFPHLLLFGGDRTGTDWQASFATFGPISLGNASPNLLLFGGDGTRTDRRASFATFGPISLGSTHLKKVADNDANAKPLSNKEVYSLLNSLRLEVSSLKPAQNSDTAKMQSLQMVLSSPPLALLPYHQTPCTVSSAYK